MNVLLHLPFASDRFACLLILYFSVAGIYSVVVVFVIDVVQVVFGKECQCS